MASDLGLHYSDRPGPILKHGSIALCILQMSLKRLIFGICMPTSVAQLNARPTGDQEVASSIPIRLATFFRGNSIMKYFFTVI